jgi:hypothetical protein
MAHQCEECGEHHESHAERMEHEKKHKKGYGKTRTEHARNKVEGIKKAMERAKK